MILLKIISKGTTLLINNLILINSAIFEVNTNKTRNSIEACAIL